MREMDDLQASLSHAIPWIIIYPDSARAREAVLNGEGLTSHDRKEPRVFAGEAGQMVGSRPPGLWPWC